MARKTKEFTATTDRDKGRRYLITEMSAAQGEKWAYRFLLAMGRSGITVPEGYERLGMEGFGVMIGSIGLRALFGMQFTDAEPLLDEMMACVQFIPEGGTAANAVPLLLEGHIEETQTIWQLRDEVVALHVGFSVADRLRKWGESVRQTAEPTPSTSTSPKPSGRSSPRGSRR